MQALKFKRKGINKAEKEQRKKSMVLVLLLRPSLILRTAHSYRFRPISTTTNTIIKMSFKFGPYKIDPKEVFYSTHLSYAMVNLRPILPVKRFVDLTADETSDLWITAQKVGSRLECYHNASSLTFSIQDGPEAGQTVPHVHIHIIPRKSGDFENNDEIYDAIDVKEKELKQTLDLDKERKDRSIEEMAQEADDYRSLLS